MKKRKMQCFFAKFQASIVASEKALIFVNFVYFVYNCEEQLAYAAFQKRMSVTDATGA